MGQYYKPCLLNETKDMVESWACSHKFGNGLKLMEHSYIGNNFVGIIENNIADNPKPVVWAGDYADGENGDDDGDNLYSVAEQGDELLYDEMPSADLEQYKYSRVQEESELYWGVFERQMIPESYRYIVNHDKNEFIDKSKSIVGEYGAIHPLPLMTCEGNGRGGGDFRGESELVGAWARDVISVSETKPEGFSEVIFDIVED